jgi:hypothetical protein
VRLRALAALLSARLISNRLITSPWSQLVAYCRFGRIYPNGAPPLAMPRQWRTVRKDKQAEKIP